MNASGATRTARIRGALAGAPLGVYFVITGALFALITWLVGLATEDYSGPVSLVFRSVLFGGAMTWFLRRSRRRSGGTDALVAVSGGVRSGVLPADAEPTIWRPGLAEQRRQLSWARKVGSVVFVGIAGLAVVLALTESGRGGTWWWIAAGFLTFALVSQVLVPRQLARIDRLSAELDVREAGRPPG